ncbi:aldo/keto reductase [Pseudonocardia nigra]|uniref:aldo/keto reductase n=1 Tax=Pseudonocardia nigra TaxID=1921578 RepID=UPI001C5FD398|nr:aldo/keto reductase [Pseudonocardia nigra]
MKPAATREVGRTGVEVTQLGFGGGALKLPRPEYRDEDATAALDAAWAGGVRYYDTAPFYGRGISEQRLGRFLGGRCDESFVVSTKVGRLIRPARSVQRPAARTAMGDVGTWEVHYDYSRDGVLRSIEDSIQRLGISAIDLVLVHDLDLVHLAPQARMDAHTDDLLRSGWAALQDLKAQGVIRGVGFGINEIGLVPHWLDRFDPDLFLVAGPYTLMEQGGLAELNRCADRGVGVVIGQVFASGILTTGPVAGATYYYREAGAEERERARRLQEVCAAFDVPLPAAAVQFPLGHPAVAAVIPGVKNAGEAQSCLEAFGHDIPAQLWTALRDEGLLAPDTPTPA